ncbi:histidine kinase N-terminal 7TM domain-containing protein [Halorientalis marina]|jgi:hypothetical protein|uniref:histidine kinase N-terminal 7TM domain-containing protein n=1 Tax=Halorientalis marina TaxID=2931976 RepID=UPI001FF396B7|nr:histidine kinase N-terminal 7TM domain-containing protein [Halorientalis marina]
MSWQSTPYTIPLGITALIVAGLFAVTLTQRSQKGAYTMLGLFGAIVVWAGSYALQLASTVLGQALFWNTLRFAGPSLVTLAFIVFALQYTGRADLVTRRNVAVLAVVPVLTNVLVWTNYLGVHGLVRASAEMTTTGDLARLTMTYGPWYYIHALYSLALSFAAIALFVGHWRRTSGQALRRTQLFTVGGVLPTVGTLFYAAELTAIDWGPVTYVVTACCLVVALFYY